MTTTKLCVLTGGNAGIGYEATRQILSKNNDPNNETKWKVIILCRDESRAKAAVEQLKESTKSDLVEYVLCDLGDVSSVKKFVKQFSERFGKDTECIDALVCNAGVVMNKFEKSSAGLETTFHVNHMGHFMLTVLLLPFMKENGQICIVSSELHNYVSLPKDPAYLKNLTENDSFDGMKVYSLSKLYNLWFQFQLCRLLESSEKKLVVVSTTPGFVPTTSLSRKSSAFTLWFMKNVLSYMPFARSLETGGSRISKCVLEKLENGKYFQDGKVKNSSKESLVEEKQKGLWNLSCEILGWKALTLDELGGNADVIEIVRNSWEQLVQE